MYLNPAEISFILDCVC